MAQKIKIETLINGKRKSTQQLLQEIYAHMEKGITDFEIDASGQHDIGGPLWTKTGDTLNFIVRNPGQRVGSMAMKGTNITIIGSAPADVGWLNAGATITLLGDGGDTTAHCAAAGKIYVAGRVGTRSGSLMKYDPKFEKPEFWVYKNTGSFSFEFMGGGTAVVCGVDAKDPQSVLGDRPCVGMVGGTVYVRGPIKGLSNEVRVCDLDDADKKFLSEGMPVFLKAIEKEKEVKNLTQFSEWKKIVAKSYDEKKKEQKRISVKRYHYEHWIPDNGGIFGDVFTDDLRVDAMIVHGDERLKRPEWENATFRPPCQASCGSDIPTAQRLNLIREGKYEEAIKLISEFSPFPASVCGTVCPNPCMESCTRNEVDLPIEIGKLGMLSYVLPPDKPGKKTGKKVAIIGGGAGGLATAWRLRKAGHSVAIYEADKKLGGKFLQGVPADRLPRDIINAEIEKIVSMGIDVYCDTKVDKKLYEKIYKDNDAVVIASGSHVSKIPPIPGLKEFGESGFYFLKDVNSGKKPKVSKKVVIFGAGNVAMDVAVEALKYGAEHVTCIDIQKPACFSKEMKNAASKGVNILFPVQTEKVTKKAVYLTNGKVLEADTVLVSIGENPDISYLPEEFQNPCGGFIKADKFGRTHDPKVFSVGDVVKPGLFTDAVGMGNVVGMMIDASLNKKQFIPGPRPAIEKEKLHTTYFTPIAYPHKGINTNPVIDAQDEHLRCISCGICRDCYMCLESCPEGAISRVAKDDGTFEYISNDEKCIGCAMCSGICPSGIWQMKDNITATYFDLDGDNAD